MYLVVLGNSHGLFSVFTMVLGALSMFEHGLYSGVKVNLEHGAYTEFARGSNWWEYYFEPITVGNLDPPRIDLHQGNAWGEGHIAHTDFRFMNRNRSHELIERYIHPKPHVLAEVERFISQYFTDRYVIGVGYRGTDIHKEANVTSYQTMRDALQVEIDRATERGVTPYFFVATDEQQFLDYMRVEFGDRVLAYERCFRATNGQLEIYMSDAERTFPWSGRYDMGFSAIVDCLLLSRTATIIRTTSNLSLVSTFFNPTVNVTALSKRRWET